MIEFILFSMALLVIVIWLIAPALLRKQAQAIDSSKHINIAIARERLSELEAQLDKNDITQEQYEQSRDEIESALLDDADATTDKTNELPVSYKRYILVMLTAIPFVAFGLYQHWGKPEAITGITQPAAQTENPHGAQQQKHASSMEEMLTKLEARLANNPNDPNGWYMLGRSYMVQKQYDKATDAFRKLHSLVGDQPDVLLGLADAMTMSRSGDMRGEPFTLARRALELAPDNVTALWLTGLGYQDEGDLQSAIKMWQKLLPLLASDPESANKVQALITNAQQQLGNTATASSSTAPGTPPHNLANIKVSVDIDKTLRNMVSDNDHIMVYAQRVKGMKMPLAMVRAQVKDLPMTVNLSDSNALSPMNKLSDEKQVNVIARISKSGQATKQDGDIEIKAGPYPVSGSNPVSITISR